MEKFVATYGESVQVSTDDYRFIKTSKIFNDSSSIKDILDWLNGLGIKEPCITMIDFSSLDDIEKTH